MLDKKQFQKPDIQYRPDIRWWLAEGFHTDKTLKEEIESLHTAGFGGVEFLAMQEPGADSSLYGWGSEEWVHDSHTVVAETTRRGMSVSMTSGTNWANANLITITPDDKAASKELDYTVEHLCAGERRTGALAKAVPGFESVKKVELEAVVAVRTTGESENNMPVLLAESAVVLTDAVENEALDWTAPADGEWLLFAFWLHGTGQTAEPSVSTSYTVNYLDHYGIDAFIEYWENVVLTPELQENLKANGRAMMYMDSLELGTFGRGGQLWGYHFREEFLARRGYDITPYLPFVVRDCGQMQDRFVFHYTCADKIFLEKLRNDLHQTMTDLYMANMMQPMQEWLHKHHMELRSEISYGLPFEISQPGKYVDGIETESLEFISQLDLYRGLAGTAHIYRRLYSSETGATRLNYMMPLDFYTQIIFTQFAAGVARTVLHGYSSIAGCDADTHWPGHEGMWPIFSERFGKRQPTFCHYDHWTDMISRFQYVLRRGDPRMDIAMLRLDYNYNNVMFRNCSEQDMYENQWMRAGKGFYWQDCTLQNMGYTWDYFAPQLLEEDFVDWADGMLQKDGPGYRAVIVYQEGLPLSSAKKLLQLVKKGLPVVFVDGVTEMVRPNEHITHTVAACRTPYLDGQDDALAALVAEMKQYPNVRTATQAGTPDALRELGVEPRIGRMVPDSKLLTHLREENGVWYAFIYNMQYTDSEPFCGAVRLGVEGKPYLLDAWTGEISPVGLYQHRDGSTWMDVTLAPGQACLFAIDPAGAAERHAEAVTEGAGVCGGEAIVWMPGEHTVEYSDGSYRVITAECPAGVEITDWTLQVESWNAGDKVVIHEDRGLGIVTDEVYYETKKTLIDAGKVELVSWNDIPAVGREISGIGRYTGRFTLPESWQPENVAILTFGSAQGATLKVAVNGKAAKPVDFDALCVDISDLLQPGENTVTVELATTLNNRLMANGYYDMVEKLSLQLAHAASNANSVVGEDDMPENADVERFEVLSGWRSYGLIGPAVLNLAVRVPLD